MDTFEKNLEALKIDRFELYKKLREIESNSRFEVFLAEGDEYANILDKKNNYLFYDDAKVEIEHKNKELEKYREYIYLYFFGIADGKNIQKLLENTSLNQIVIIEPNIELIYIALNLIDFSKDIETNRLYILEYSDISFSWLIKIINTENAKIYIRTFNLNIIVDYYEKYYLSEYQETFKLFIKAIEYVTQANGNDINDTFRGVKQHFQHLDLMIENLKYQELLKKKSVKTAVVVSTGPSLDKQLSLLKKYQSKVAILSVDASFPILVKHGIKPDFVFSMERDEPTAKFFQEVDEKDQKDVIILTVSLQHEVLFESLKSDFLFVVMRPFAYNFYFDLDEFGYICKGMSSANMAHEFASAFGFENTILIGQDLAFGDNLKTHSDDHIIDKDAELEAEIQSGKLIDVVAYGGKGVVKTNIYWNIFRNFIEHHIEDTASFMTTYNATEGGSRILGAIEMPFKDLMEKFAIEKKELIVMDAPNPEEIARLKISINEKLYKAKEELLSLQEKVNKSFLVLAKECEAVEGKDIDEAIKVFNTGETIFLLEEISKTRKFIENNSIYRKFLISIIQPLMHSMEIEIAEIKVRYVDNANDNQIKALQWILAHRFWLFSFSGVIENVIHIIDEHIATNE
ncbi:MAG: 6-hydroxymethylpterin diphosphokinase MptE-like protein [Campylobacterota bacterium]|nr:6-hydroxymethylpterin diphosphokinase MptE-like protein [Campylobacterota bacterium]